MSKQTDGSFPGTQQVLLLFFRECPDAQITEGGRDVALTPHWKQIVFHSSRYRSLHPSFVHIISNSCRERHTAITAMAFLCGRGSLWSDEKLSPFLLLTELLLKTFRANLFWLPNYNSNDFRSHNLCNRHACHLLL